MGVPHKRLLRCPFRDVSFHNADFSKAAAPSFGAAPGYLIDRAELANMLVKAAVRQGVTLVDGCAVTDAQLKEPGTVLALTDGGELHGRLLLLASGWQSPLVDRIGLPRALATTGYWTATVDAAVAPNTARPVSQGGMKPRVGVVLGLDRQGSFALYCVSKDRVSISINCLGELVEAGTLLCAVCRIAWDQKVLPVDLTQQAGQVKPVFSPAGAALDMDSHVAKHTLLIGDAGGFVAAASNEGTYPAMWSARIAARIIHVSLGSVHSQDELMKFDSVWRVEMADYLRSPQTDTQFLIPLIFSNQPMADRMGAAFFSGENI
jgi:flavin-dependent dehydrogenase